MARITLTAARVTALRPRKSAYDTRDSKLTGFGVRVLPSGQNSASLSTANIAGSAYGRSSETPIP